MATDPKELLAEMRWTADRIVVSPTTGERVWLKQIPGGITDCCDPAYPCDYHSQFTLPAPNHKQ